MNSKLKEQPTWSEKCRIKVCEGNSTIPIKKDIGTQGILPIKKDIPQKRILPIAVFRFIESTWYFLLKKLRFKTVLDQLAHRYNFIALTKKYRKEIKWGIRIYWLITGFGLFFVLSALFYVIDSPLSSHT